MMVDDALLQYSKLGGNMMKNLTCEDCMKSVREQLFSCMNERNWTINRIAIECGLSYDGFCRIYYGRSKDINFSTLLKISEGLRKPILVLVGLQDDEETYISKAAAKQLLNLVERFSGILSR